MIRFSFRLNQVFIEGLVRWMLRRRLVTGMLQFENEKGEIKVLSNAEVLSLWNRGEWVVDENSLGSRADAIYIATPRDLSTFPEKWQIRVGRYMHYLNAVKPDQIKFNPLVWGKLIEDASREINDPKPPCAGSVHEWWRKYRRTKSPISLIPKNIVGLQHPRDYRYSIFEDIVAEVYLTLQKRKKSEVVKGVNDRIRQVNVGKQPADQIPILCKSTIYRWLEQLQQDVVDAARLGSEKARVKYRMSMSGLKVSSILERVEIDHTPIDLIVIEKQTMLPLGRPWLTLAIDKHSRMVVGFYICFNAPSSYSVLQCLKQMILPKDDWLARFPDIQGKWPAYGIPQLIATDNGMDLHSEAFQSSCLEMGIQILYCPAARPETKGSVERMFRSINQGLIHSLPGTVFTGIDERGDYPAEDLACIDLETLVHLMTKWIVDDYNVSYHRGIATTPLLKWMESAEKCMIELPVYPQSLDVITGIPAKRTIFHYGIELDSLHYNSKILQEIRRRAGENIQVQLKFYEDDIGYIHVYDPHAKEYIKVEASDQNYASGMNREVHRLAKAHARKRFGESFSHAQLSEARLGIQEIIKNAITYKKMSTRKNSAKVFKHDSEAVRKSENPIADALKPVKSAKLNPPEKLPDGLDDDLPNLLNPPPQKKNDDDPEEELCPL